LDLGLGSAFGLRQWFSNCGTQELFKWYTKISADGIYNA